MNFDGGGLIRSHGGRDNLNRARKEHERSIGDERILGDSMFVQNALKADELKLNAVTEYETCGWDLDVLITAVCNKLDVDPDAITQRGRNCALSSARGIVCYMGVRILAIPGQTLAIRLNMSAPAVSKAISRGKNYCVEHGLGLDQLGGSG